MLKSRWKLLIGVSVLVVGSSLLLSGGALLGAGDDVFSVPNVQPASASSSHIRTLTPADIESAEKAIRGSEDISAVVSGVPFAIDDLRLAYVEDIFWGFSAVLRLDKATRLSGPWITVDTTALVASVRPDLDAERVAKLTHDEMDKVLAGSDVTAANYTTRTDRYEVTTELILLTIQPETGDILRLVPFEEPPSLWGGTMPMKGPGTLDNSGGGGVSP